MDLLSVSKQHRYTAEFIQLDNRTSDRLHSGIKYISFDSLCIFHASPQVWRFEAAHVNKIYADSYNGRCQQRPNMFLRARPLFDISMHCKV